MGKLGETYRKHLISEPTYYAWKQKYAGMDVSQLRRLKELESECSLLKCVKCLRTDDITINVRTARLAVFLPSIRHGTRTHNLCF